MLEYKMGDLLFHLGKGQYSFNNRSNELNKAGNFLLDCC
jgi:hypothetical protein